MKHAPRATHRKAQGETCSRISNWRRGRTMYRELLSPGAKPDMARSVAAFSRLWWHNSMTALHNVLTIAHFDRLGMPRLS
jgi:RNA-directed DNA polymerase